MSSRKPCVSSASMISAAPFNSGTTAARGLALAGGLSMLRSSICPPILGAVLILLPAAAGAAIQKPAPRVNPNAAVIADFVKRVDAYIALHRKLEDTLPKLSKQTNPTEIDGHQRALARLIQ